MSFITNWFSAGDAHARMRPQRIVSVDLETSGLDTKNDSIISFGGVAILDGEVRVDDGFEAIVEQANISTDENIAIHGVMGDAQRNGMLLADAMQAFESWRDGAPIIGWHIAFDIAFLTRAAKTLARAPIDDDTLCVAEFAALLSPQYGSSFDAHAAALGIRIDQRHHAAADAWATALVYSHYAERAERQGVHGYQAQRSMVKRARWLQ
jgi:DNA polymerase III subunit epsilon